jgi:hypothetical protein
MVTKNISKKFIGKASPNFNKQRYLFGNGNGGFPADSLLGYSYAIFEEGMDLEEIKEALYYSQDFRDKLVDNGIDLEDEDRVHDFILETAYLLLFELGIIGMEKLK